MSDDEGPPGDPARGCEVRAVSVELRTLVVYESMFGNTQRVAEAVAAGLADSMRVELVEVASAPRSLDEDLDLLVVGGPTHAHGMSGRDTRRTAADHAEVPVVSAGIGLREWFDSLRSRPGVPSAAFDTRFDGPRWQTGSAARIAAERLRQHGYRLAAPPESFRVLGMTGPLADGEHERACRWGQKLGAGIARRVHAAS
jgi:hypothetical protein